MRFLLVVVALSACLWSVSAQKGTNGFCELIWRDEFDGDGIDFSKWEHEPSCNGGGNGELQCYTTRPENAYIDNGQLVLKAIKEQWENKGFTSGKLITRKNGLDTGSWLRGRFEIRAKLPRGSHLWPAIWMMPTDSEYGGWAASGEIDIMEFRGQEVNKMMGTLHYGGKWPNNRWKGGDKDYDFDLTEEFHTFELEWENDQMRWYMDGDQFHEQNLNQNWYGGVGENPYTADGQPWDKRFFLILNLAIGGNFFGGFPALTDQDVEQWVSNELRVEYVRMWKQGGDCEHDYDTTPTPSAQEPATSQEEPTPSSEEPKPSTAEEPKPSTGEEPMSSTVAPTAATEAATTTEEATPSKPEPAPTSEDPSAGGGANEEGEQGEEIAGQDAREGGLSGSSVGAGIGIGISIMVFIALVAVAVLLVKRKEYVVAFVNRFRGQPSLD